MSGCDTHHAEDTGFYTLPSNPATRKKWIEVCGFKSWQSERKIRVCWKHFQREDFCNPIDPADWDECPGKGFGRLKKGTVPTQNLPVHVDPNVDLTLGQTEVVGATKPDDINENLANNDSVSPDVVNELIDHDYATSGPPPKNSKEEPPKKDKKAEHSKDSRLSRMKKTITLLKNQIKGFLQNGKIPKKTRRKIVEEELSHKFTPGQIHQMLKPRGEILKIGPRKGKRRITRSEQAILLILVSTFLKDLLATLDRAFKEFLDLFVDKYRA